MQSYHHDELFDEHGKFRAEFAELAPKGRRRMGMNAHANGGLLWQPLKMPKFQDFAVDVPHLGATTSEATRVLGKFLGEVMKYNLDSKNFRIFGPDETASNRIDDSYVVSGKTWLDKQLPVDVSLSPDGRYMEILSEHMCQGWLFSLMTCFTHCPGTSFTLLRSRRCWGDGVEGDGRSGAAGAICGGGLAAGEAVDAAVRGVWHLASDRIVVDQTL